MQGKAATPAEQWTDTSLLRCFAHNAVQCCSADAAMHDTLQGSSCALLWFRELCSFCFTSFMPLQFFHTLKEVLMEEAQRLSQHTTDFSLFQKVSEHYGNSCLGVQGHHPETDPRGPRFLSDESCCTFVFCEVFQKSHWLTVSWNWMRRREVKLTGINIQKISHCKLHISMGEESSCGPRQ